MISGLSRSGIGSSRVFHNNYIADCVQINKIVISVTWILELWRFRLWFCVSLVKKYKLCWNSNSNIKKKNCFSFDQCFASWWARKDQLCGPRRLYWVRNRCILLPINVIFFIYELWHLLTFCIFRCCNAGQKCCDTGMTNICLSVDECPWGL